MLSAQVRHGSSPAALPNTPQYPGLSQNWQANQPPSHVSSARVARISTANVLLFCHLSNMPRVPPHASSRCLVQNTLGAIAQHTLITVLGMPAVRHTLSPITCTCRTRIGVPHIHLVAASNNQFTCPLLSTRRSRPCTQHITNFPGLLAPPIPQSP